MKPKLIPVYTGDIEPLQFGDYPVAYWGYREVFCSNHQGGEDPEPSIEVPQVVASSDYKSDENNPAITLTQYLSRFSLFEKLCNGCLDNHSTVKMKSGACITFSDGRVYIGTDVYTESCPEANEIPLWTWSEPYPGDGMWMSREDNK